MQFLYWLENLRIPMLNELMLLITHLGEETAFLAIAIVVFWCVDKYEGYYMMAVGLFGNLVNQFMKILFRIPRPWVKDPNFHALEAAIPEAGGYSFPSGHSQTAVGTFGCIAASQKNKIIRWVCIAVMVLVPFSRMYVGVHTPADVLVGSAMALIMVFAFRPLMLGNRKKNIPYVFLGMLVLGVAFLVYVLRFAPRGHIAVMTEDFVNLQSAQKNAYTFLGCFAALPIVYWVDEKKLHFETKAIWWAQILKAALGLGLVLAVKSGTKSVLEALIGHEFIARAVRYFLVVMVAGILWPMTFKWFSKLGRKEK